ncbi:ABCB family ABC transporter ATP-binding protein/permease [Catenovulum maritimum]|uniref:Metal ABC transporter permease n=1 Tax=Catenovulum maritimum TaxID=1513271 RepID=A0A0J8GRJ0_9ALTE|nr:ABC transporter ATP-binding protein/permease [Catenovulum maritimum]KMT63904.1 metal ABC transporter permease [Catenovulum maritimum]
MRPSNYNDFNNKPINWQVFHQILPYLLDFKGRVALALSCLILAKFASVSLPFILKHIVDDLNPNETSQMLLAVPLSLLLAYGAVRLVNTLVGEIRDTLFGRVTERAMRKLGLEVFKHLHRLDIDFHLTRQTGGVARDIDRGTNGISFLMRFMVFNIIPTILEISIVVGIFLINYGWQYAAIILAAVASYISYSIWATEWRTTYVRAAAKADSISSTRAIDSLLNYETVKYFNNEDYEANRYDTVLAEWEIAKRKNRLTLFVLNGGQAFIISAAMTAMMVLAGYQVADGKITIGDFVLVNAFMMQLFMPLNFLGFVYREIKGSLANIENMFELLNKKPLITSDEQARNLIVDKAQIEFKDVSFSYQPDREILKNISFKVLPKQKVAIVGESGSGKSSIIKLLFRFYDTGSGSINIDEQNIQKVDLLSLRKSIGIVPQDTVLFNDTIFENVKYGRPSATDEEVEEALKLAHLSNFVSNLPKGSQTLVGERGLKLSGGEKQRVAIARTILKRPPIMVFDEATSSLDSQSEQAILNAFKEVSQGHTSIVIAHRLSTIVDADNIIVLNHGEIVEQGTHHSLLLLNGRYAQMWHTQQDKA